MGETTNRCRGCGEWFKTWESEASSDWQEMMSWDGDPDDNPMVEEVYGKSYCPECEARRSPPRVESPAAPRRPTLRDWVMSALAAVQRRYVDILSDGVQEGYHLSDLREAVAPYYRKGGLASLEKLP
jgi:hypothetical protein